MIPAATYNDVYKKLSEYEEESKAIGFLIAKPQVQGTQESIIQEFNYYNYRSGKYIDFFLPGYSMYGHNNSGDEILIGHINNAEIYYSDQMFCNFIEEIEYQSKWEYSGETELLIVNSIKQKLDYSNCLLIHFEKAIKVQAIPSIRNFMEKIIRLSKKETDTQEFQQNNISKSIAFSTIEIFLDELPFKTGTMIKRAEVFKKNNFKR